MDIQNNKIQDTSSRNKRGYSYRYGVITAIKNSKVRIVLNQEEQRKSCEGCSLCATDIPVVTISLRVKSSLEQFKEGSRVAVGTVKINEVEAALIAFIFPVITALVTYFVLSGLMKYEGDSALVVLSTLVMGGAALFSISLIDQLLRFFFTPILEPHVEFLDPEAHISSCS